MPSFSHIFILYPLFCKDILETTTLTLSTSTPPTKQQAPPFFLRHAPWSARCAKRCLVACRSRRCHSSVTGIPEGLIVPSHDLKGRVPWGHSHGQLKNTLTEIYLRISGWWKNILFFFCKSCKVATSQNPISSRMMERFLQPVFNQLGEMKLMSNLLHLSSFKVSFWAQTEPNSYLLLGERKPKVTCF